jgi:hypothetical protein
MSNVTDLKKQWLKDPEFKASYDGMADEFELASVVIEARSVAEATGTHLKISFEQ